VGRSSGNGGAPRPAGVPAKENLPREVEVAIVGAGFGGLGAAIQLKRAGFEDFVVLERADDVGGTWWANTYPGCQCDVPSNLYSFSFAPKPDWTHSYPMQQQILDYLRDCAHEFGVVDRIRLGCEVLEAAWSEDERRWQIDTSAGRLQARFLIGAPGLLSEPSAPELPGRERFAGTSFHSAQWDHDHDVRGRRVAVIGTGASAIQIVPSIQPLVERVYVFQRTPPWVVPHPGRPVGPRLRRLYRRVPAVQRLARSAVYAIREGYVVGMALRPRLLRLLELISRVKMRREIPDPELRRKVTPDYTFGCKRLLPTNSWYPALAAPNVELVTEAVAELRERSIVGDGGTEREVDTVIFATGFSPTDPPFAKIVRGKGGETLSESWAGSPRAYLGTTVSGFPNFFLLYGPNLNLGHSSVLYMMERQIEYMVEGLRTARARGLEGLEVRREVEEAWNADLQERLAGSVWDTGGCSSWYLDRNGRNSIMWPDFTFNFRRRVREFDLRDYEVWHATAARSAEAVGGLSR
jgi:cation diffusion facilitator CzcD-associated flavoprotein CzcO